MVPDLQHSQMHNAMTKKSILKKYIYYSPFSPFRTKSRKRVTFSEPLVASKRRKLGDVATSQPHNQPESLVKENDKENKTIDTTRNEHGSGHQKAQEINKPEMPLFAHGTIENTNPSQKAKLLMEKPVHENDSGAIMKVHPLPVDSTSPRGIISSPTQDKTENKSTEDVKTLTKNPVKCESNDPAEQIKAHESNPTKKAEVLLVHSTFNFHHEDGVDLKANIRRRRMAFNSIKLDRGSKFTHANEADLTNDTNMPKITLSPAKAHKVEIDSGEWPTKRKGPFSGKEVMVLEKRIKKFARREKLSMESLQTILQGKPSHHLKFWKYIAKSFPDRSLIQLSMHTRRRYDQERFRKMWTPQEDKRLMEFIILHGTKFTVIAQAMGRGRRSCRARYRNLCYSLLNSRKGGNRTAAKGCQ